MRGGLDGSGETTRVRGVFRIACGPAGLDSEKVVLGWHPRVLSIKTPVCSNSIPLALRCAIPNCNPRLPCRYYRPILDPSCFLRTYTIRMHSDLVGETPKLILLGRCQRFRRLRVAICKTMEVNGPEPGRGVVLGLPVDDLWPD